MSGTALALVLTAAVAHALWNFAVKRVRADLLAFIWTYIALSVLVWVPVTLVWLLVRAEPLRWSWLGCAAVSAVLHIGYQLVLQHGYSVGDLNLVYPLARGTGPLLTFVVAVAVLGDRPGGVAVAGVAAVLAGVALITVGPRVVGRRTGAVWGLLTGVSIAAYTLWDAFSVRTVGADPLAYFTLGLVVQLVLLTYAVRHRLPTLGPTWREQRGPALAVAVLSPLAYVLVLRAMQLAPVALVAPARESSIVIGSLLGWLVLKEPRPARRLVGAAIVLAGIAALAVG